MLEPAVLYSNRFHVPASSDKAMVCSGKPMVTLLLLDVINAPEGAKAPLTATPLEVVVNLQALVASNVTVSVSVEPSLNVQVIAPELVLEP